MMIPEWARFGVRVYSSNDEAFPCPLEKSHFLPAVCHEGRSAYLTDVWLDH